MRAGNEPVRSLREALVSVDSSIPGTGAEERHTKGSLARPLGMVGTLIIWVGWGAWRVWDLAVSNIAWLDQSVRTLRLALPDASLATKSVFLVGLTVGGIVWSLLPILFVMAWSAMASSPSDTPRRQRIGNWARYTLSFVGGMTALLVMWLGGTFLLAFFADWIEVVGGLLFVVFVLVRISQR